MACRSRTFGKPVENWLRHTHNDRDDLQLAAMYYDAIDAMDATDAIDVIDVIDAIDTIDAIDAIDAWQGRVVCDS